MIEADAKLREPVWRTSEIEDVTNLRFIHPIASHLTILLASLRVTPNAVSLAGMACGIIAGIAYAHVSDSSYIIIGFVMMLAWHVLDGADGQLARMTNTQSQSGKVLDGICDYVTFIAVYAGLALALSARHGDWVWLLVIVSGGFHALQSAAYEMQRQEYSYWGQARSTMNFCANAPASAGISGRLHGFYSKCQALAAGNVAAFHDRIAAIVAADPDIVPILRDRYRMLFAPAVRRWAVLSSNYRTIAIFLFAAFGVPLWYFWFEIIGLSLALLVLRAEQPARYGRLFRTLSAG